MDGQSDYVSEATTAHCLAEYSSSVKAVHIVPSNIQGFFDFRPLPCTWKDLFDTFLQWSLRRNDRRDNKHAVNIGEPLAEEIQSWEPFSGRLHSSGKLAMLETDMLRRLCETWRLCVWGQSVSIDN